jgi:tRNA(fMet)-specific endonuclease VapC
MSYVLDTDTLIYFLKGQEKVVRHVGHTAVDRLSITIVNHTELLFGAFNSSHPKKNLEKIQSFLNQFKTLPFCEESSYIFGKQKSELKKQGKIIADLDLMIASIVLKNHCILITNNTKHFVRVPGLKMDNWA